MLEFIRFLRTTDPKYSFEVLIFNITLGFVAGACAVLGKTGCWMLASGVLWISLGIHYFRLRRVLNRRLRAERVFLERMRPSLEAAIACYEHKMRAAHPEPIDPAELALLREDVERARQREAAGEP
jgi:hypothetical protein